MFSYCITQDIWKNNDLNSHQEIMMTSQRRVKSLFTNSACGLMRKQKIYIKRPVFPEKYFILKTYLINISISHYSIAQMQTRPPSSGNEMFRFHNFWWKKKHICMIPKQITDVFRKCKGNCVTTGFFRKYKICKIVSQEGSAKSSHVRTQLDGDALPHSI